MKRNNNAKKEKKQSFPPGFFKDWEIDNMDFNRPADEKQNGEPEVRREEEKDYYVDGTEA